MIKRGALLIQMSAVMLVGCGGGASYANPKQLAEKLGCTSYNAEVGAVAPGDVATCQFNGQQVTVVVGKNGQQRDDTVNVAKKAASTFGASSGLGVVEGGSWAVLTEDAATASLAQKKVGGKVQ